MINNIKIDSNDEIQNYYNETYLQFAGEQPQRTYLRLPLMIPWYYLRIISSQKTIIPIISRRKMKKIKKYWFFWENFYNLKNNSFIGVPD